MSKLSEKPVSIPRPLRTRDLILKVLDTQALPISTRELAAQLHKLGPRPTQAGLKENLDELLRVGHIRREHDPETGPHWVRVPGNKPPSERLRDQTLQIRDWVLDTLKHGPATARMLVEGAKRAGIIAVDDNPSHAALLIGNCLQPLCKDGRIDKTPISTVTGTVQQYRLPGVENQVDLVPIKPKITKAPEPISDLQKGILEWLAANSPATAAEMTPYLITAGILKPGDQAARTVGSACHGLQKRGDLQVAGLQKSSKTVSKLWGLPGQAVSDTAPKPATTPDLSAIDRIEQSIDDLSAALEQLRRDLRRAA